MSTYKYAKAEEEYILYCTTYSIRFNPSSVKHNKNKRQTPTLQEDIRHR